LSFQNLLFILILTSSITGFIGFKMGESNQPPPVIIKETAPPKIPEELTAKFEQLSTVDINEYLILKDQKARYEKADEILGKFLMIMLYDFGLRVSESQLKTLKSTVIEPPIAQSPSVTPQLPGLSVQNSVPEKAVDNKIAPKAKVKQNGKLVADLIDDSDVRDFLKKNEIKNFFNQFQGGALLNQTQMNLLNGDYYGSIIFDDPKAEPWQVEMHIQGRVIQGRYRGQHEIIVTKNGKLLSRTRGSLKDDDYRTLPDDPASFLINAYGDDGYFQLYHFPRRNELSGNFYIKRSVGKFLRIGIVSLKRF
jgi:hypothetical protein